MNHCERCGADAANIVLRREIDGADWQCVVCGRRTPHDVERRKRDRLLAWKRLDQRTDAERAQDHADAERRERNYRERERARKARAANERKTQIALAMPSVSLREAAVNARW